MTRQFESTPDDSLAPSAKRWIDLEAIQAAPWQPPASLGAALNSIADEPAVWLKRAVDIMAFGDGSAADDPLETAARRCQASRWLCQEGARRAAINLIGNPDRPGDGSISIPRAYFDTPRMMGAAEDSIVTDDDSISDDQFTARFEGNHQKWFNVRVETQSLLGWLRVRDDLAPIDATSSKIAEGKAKRGPRFKYDWPHAREYFDKLMGENGDLEIALPGWSAQVDIEKRVGEYMEKHCGGRPSPSLLQEYIPEWLTNFRASYTR